MTEQSPPASSGTPEWLPLLTKIIRGSAHETRNALNGVAVNLEVVRSRLSRTAGGSPEVAPYAGQAIAQAEELVKLTEGVGSLLMLISGAIGTNGVLQCTKTDGTPPGLSFEVDAATAERTIPGLRGLGQAVGFSAETDGGTVIFRFRTAGSPAIQERE